MRGFELVRKSKKHIDSDDIKMPLRKTKYSAGYDFYLPYDITVYPKESTGVIFTDIKAYMLNDEYLDINIRSSVGIKQEIRLMNCTPIIDSDYYNNVNNDGNIGICLWNFGNKVRYFFKGDAIVQGIFKKYLIADNCNCDDIRQGGVGSTN